MKKNWFNIIVFVLTIVLFLGIILFTNTFDLFIYNIKTMNPIWFAITILAVFFCWGIEAYTLHILTNRAGQKQRFASTLRITLIGQLFNSITPFSHGGQFYQVYALSKNGVNSGDASAIVMLKLIIYQVVFTLYALVILLLKYSYFAPTNQIDAFMYIIFIGFASNLIVTILLFAAIKYTAVAKKIVQGMFSALSKVKIIKKYQEMEKKLEDEFENFKNHYHNVKENKEIIIKATVLTIIQITAFLSITYTIYKSFKLGGEGPFNLMAGHAFVLLFSSYIPSPGASLGAEGSFYLIFQKIFTPDKILSAMFIWRFVTCYFNVIFGGIALMFFRENDLQNTEIQKKNYVNDL